MNCLKCGKPTGTSEKNVFCPDCLKVMEAFPVKPGTPVQIPKRQPSPRRAQTHNAPKPEAVIEELSHKLFRARILCVVLALVFVLSTGILGFLLYRASTAPVIGSNYSTVSTDDPAP